MLFRSTKNIVIDKNNNIYAIVSDSILKDYLIELADMNPDYLIRGTTIVSSEGIEYRVQKIDWIEGTDIL